MSRVWVVVQHLSVEVFDSRERLRTTYANSQIAENILDLAEAHPSLPITGTGPWSVTYAPVQSHNDRQEKP